MVDLDASARLLAPLDDGGGAAAGALEGDGLLLGTIHLCEEREEKNEIKNVKLNRGRKESKSDS